MDAAQWSRTNRTQPFSFLYEFSRTPYHEIIANSKRFLVETIRQGERKLTRITVDHPAIWHITFVLFFDENQRLVERHKLTITGKERQPRLYEKHFFSDYEEFKDESGESIYFPRLIVYKYYVGKRNDGTEVDYLTETMRVKNIKFNIPIPDEKFTLQFPSDIEVWDGVTNLGFIQPADLPPALSGSKGSMGWVKVTLICLVSAAIVAVAIMIVRSLKRGKKLSQGNR